MNDNNIKISKFLSLVLRHKPETIDIVLDELGYANVKDILSNAPKKLGLTKDILEEVVSNNDKQRFSFNENHTKIRASQGHSINVDLKLEEQLPPDILFHGTITKNLNSIMTFGILKQRRQFVHLSDNINTANDVAKRRCLHYPVVLKINTKKMSENNKFFKSDNGVWLTEHVSPKYIEEVLYVPVAPIKNINFNLMVQKEDNNDNT